MGFDARAKSKTPPSAKSRTQAAGTQGPKGTARTGTNRQTECREVKKYEEEWQRGGVGAILPRMEESRGRVLESGGDCGPEEIGDSLSSLRHSLCGALRATSPEAI